ncbi:prepilin-type N-terminal cleavage/methylation domain-containing protein [bacterium]|nr:MAG: prepilin-type N-terminal cleavage/methylation domain-containing protein [bacterium]
MSKRAFTLIELLVVIAIIAILAAILFPVFAQAKTAAKKTVAISNQKQISTGFLLYLGDSEDRYPMRTGCEQGSSINPALQAPELQGASGSFVGCGGGRFYNSMSWQTWQKYIMPYVKNVDMFTHPLRQKNATDWANNGQILNSFVVNLGLMGASVSGFTTTPWTGGTQSGIPQVGNAMILMELPHTYAAPLYTNTTTGVVGATGTNQIGHNLAVREYWRAIFLKNAGGCNTTEELEPVSSGPAEGVSVGHADGSARFYKVKDLLGKTPTMAEYLPGGSFPLTGIGANCRSATNAARGTTEPNLSISYPFWALGQ